MQKAVLDILFPEKCIVCHRILSDPESGRMCAICRRTVLPVTEPRCCRCSKSIDDVEGELCVDCQNRRFYVEAGYALYPYDERMQKAVRYFKYDGEAVNGLYFADQMAEQYGEWVRKICPEVILPVPVHKKRMRFRGFNQAACLAGRIGERLGIPVDLHYLVRTENTKPQKGLDSKARFRNLQKGFAVRKGGGTYQNILLVDDIYTTGATLEACGKVLNEEGAEKINFLCLCIGRG